MNDVSFTFPISLREIFAALIASKKARGFVVVDSIPIPPNYDLSIIIDIPDQKFGNKTISTIAVPLEFAALPDPDHAISCELYADNDEVIVDPDMVSALYEEPIRFLNDYSFVLYAKQQFLGIFKNKTDSTATLNFRFVYGIMFEKDFNNIINNYVEKIKDYLLEDRPIEMR